MKSALAEKNREIDSKCESVCVWVRVCVCVHESVCVWMCVCVCERGGSLNIWKTEKDDRRRRKRHCHFPRNILNSLELCLWDSNKHDDTFKVSDVLSLDFSYLDQKSRSLLGDIFYIKASCAQQSLFKSSWIRIESSSSISSIQRWSKPHEIEYYLLIINLKVSSHVVKN